MQHISGDITFGKHGGYLAVAGHYKYPAVLSGIKLYMGWLYKICNRSICVTQNYDIKKVKCFRFYIFDGCIPSMMGEIKGEWRSVQKCTHLKENVGLLLLINFSVVQKLGNIVKRRQILYLFEYNVWQSVVEKSGTNRH